MQIQVARIDVRDVTRGPRHQEWLMGSVAGTQITQPLLQMKKPVDAPVPLAAIIESSP